MSTDTQLPPGSRYPVALSTLGWALRPMPFMERLQKRYGDMFTIRIMQEGTWVFVSHPDQIKQVFTGDPNVLHAGAANQILLPIVGRHSVLLLDEREHMTQRKLLLPPFHGERMQRYGELMTDVAEREVATWPQGEDIALWPRMQSVTLEVIMRAVFGIRETDRLDELRVRLSTMLDWTLDPKQMLFYAALGPKRVQEKAAFRRVMDPVDEILLDEVRRRREDPEVEQRDDILSLLVQARHEDGRPMGDRELRDELMTLLVAGHETTATSLAWALERLMRHPEMLDRLREEVATGEDAYLDAVVRETLRLRPVLPITLRKLQQPMEIGGYMLPAGVSVAPCIHLVHRRPDIYPEPNRFRPERFLEQAPGTYTWIPFGGGVRRCLGASFALFEMKTVLAAVIRRARLRATDPAPERVARRAITLTPGAGTRAMIDAVEPARDEAELAGVAS